MHKYRNIFLDIIHITSGLCFSGEVVDETIIRTKTEGDTFVFTIDLTDGIANGVLTVEKK